MIIVLTFWGFYLIRCIERGMNFWIGKDCKKRKFACCSFHALILETGTNTHNLTLEFSHKINQNRHREPTLLFANCTWKLNKSLNLICFVLFLNLLWCEVKWKLCYDAKTMFKSTYALSVVDFTMLYGSFICGHAPVVIIVSRFTVGY